MTHPALAVVHEKIAQAERHADTLNNRIEADLYGEPDKLYRLVPEFNENKTECRLRVKKVGDPPVAEWDSILGDVLHNLRSALDRLAYQLAVLNGADEATLRTSEFPIFIDREKFWREGKGSGTHKIRGMAPDIRDRIQALQPYDTPQDPLWVLQQLSNSDKHRFGAKPDATVGLPIVEGPHWADCVPLTETWERPPYEDGVIAATFRLKVTGTNPKVNVKFKPTFAVTIDEGIGRNPRSMGLVVPPIINTVKEIVLDFASEFD